MFQIFKRRRRFLRVPVAGCCGFSVRADGDDVGDHDAVNAVIRGLGSGRNGHRLRSGAFCRASGAPVTEKRTFFTEHLNGRFVLTVYNGGLEDDEAIGSFASSSTITLNGAVVVGPHNFNQNTDVISVPVTLASVNELSVQLQGKPGGVVTVAITGNVNNAPFADAGINPTVAVGASVTLNGGASFDDDGDALNYRWTLIAKPSTSQAVLSNASSAFSADVEGNYVAGLVVNDGQLDSAQSQVTISALQPNATPVLESIDNVSAPLGSTLTFDLNASDSDGDTLRYSVLDLPLPPGASLDAASGRFVFKPDVNQIGVHELTFTVSDGRAGDQQTVAITVPAVHGSAPTRFRGRLLDANDYQQGIVTPIVGATVSFRHNGSSARSDSQGYFTLSNLTAGTQVLDINAATAQDSPVGGPYAGFREQYPLIAHVENHEARPFYLPRIDRDSLTQIDPAIETRVANPNLGVSFTVPPYTAKNPDGSYFTGQFSISEVPRNLAPAAMPETIDPGLLVTIQPVGITFTEPVALTFPNIDHLEPGNEVDIWSIDPEMGAFVIVGTGQVSADGQSIETIAGGVSATDWHSVLPPEANNTSQAPGSHVSPCDQDQTVTNSTLTTQSGCLNSGFSLPSYASQGKRRRLSFSYRSGRAWPNPAIPFDATIVRRSAVPPKISHQAIIGGVRQNNPSYLSTSGFSESVDETLRAVSLLDASSLATGIYPYNIRVTNHFASSSRSTTLRDSMVVINEQASPYGAGWGIAGVSRLKQNNDGRVLIYDGSGQQDVFDRVRVNLDLNQWRQQGPLSAGNWQVSGDGLSVVQTINGQPSFFVGPDNQINTTITGRFRVETRSDDDFIGFVFGYQSPQSGNGDNPNDYEFLLFDWKRRYQSGGQEGFSLSRVTGGNADLWRHTGENLEVLASQYGSGLGWRSNTDYQYELVYSDSRIVIRIDGETIFDVAGSFVPGKFGFYNYSQARVRYAHFITTSDYDASAGDYSTLVANDDGSFTRTLKNGTQIHFNAEGLQTDVVDRHGNRTRYAYNSDRQLTTITDPADLQTVFAYTDGRLDKVTDPAGRVTRFRFDNDNNLIQVTFPDGAFKRFGYDHKHLMTTEANERGFTGVREYRGNGRLKQVIRADGSVHQADHEQTIGLVAADSTFGSADNPAPVVRPEAAISVFTDGEGHSKYSNTDSFGRLIRRTDANHLTTVIDRDGDGNPIRTHRPDQLSYIDRVFDEAGNLVLVTESYNNATTRYSYDPVFNLLTSVTDPNQMALDASQRKATRYVRNPANGNLETLINALGHETHFDYNHAGQVVEIVDPNGLVTSYHYNAQGLPDTITETPPSGGGLNRVTTLTYHADGQVKTLTTPDHTPGVRPYIRYLNL
ncbi:putative Ig domain-containing protein [Methylomarinum sp. Ch1-1]|uniref:Ig domain-containing protein n=1 Tax=Methylomarinum roseum TaxID=3067653 RepID=A0AAU7NPC2_9GAMM